MTTDKDVAVVEKPMCGACATRHDIGENVYCATPVTIANDELARLKAAKAELEEAKIKLAQTGADLEAALGEQRYQKAQRDTAERDAKARLEDLRKKNSELAADRDRYRLRAEKAELAADPARMERLEQERAAAVSQAAGLQKRVDQLGRDLAAASSRIFSLESAKVGAERELETTRANLAQAFSARDRVTVERNLLAGEKKQLERDLAAARDVMSTQSRTIEADARTLEAARKALDPADAKKSYWAVHRLLTGKGETASPAKAAQ